MLEEPTLQRMGLKQGRFVFGATHLDTIPFLNWALNPELKFFILLSSCLLPSASCLLCNLLNCAFE
ncbi:MAG: hypothetical protein RLZZ507_3389 [Cyanobacteriota bacterium]|jgi:hypothetical protein